MPNKIENILEKLSHSKFRSSFSLKPQDIAYINAKGLTTIKSHTIDFLTKRLAPKIITNDGKQTPYHGHPTFIAQHATATCCRNCLAKWHHIPKNKQLSNEEITYLTTLIMTWINNQLKNR